MVSGFCFGSLKCSDIAIFRAARLSLRALGIHWLPISKPLVSKLNVTYIRSLR